MLNKEKRFDLWKYRLRLQQGTISHLDSGITGCLVSPSAVQINVTSTREQKGPAAAPAASAAAV